MLPSQKVDVVQTCQVLEYVPGMEQIIGITEDRIVSYTLAINFEDIVSASKANRSDWLDWLSNQIVAGLWEEYSRSPVLAMYVQSSPFKVYLSTQGKTTFAKIYARLQKAFGVLEAGSGYVSRYARPLVLWQPPGTMVRLWPPTDGEPDPSKVYIVDTEVDGYFSSRCDPDNAELIAGDPITYDEYAIVPREEYAVFSQGGRDYPYLNRFCNLVWE